MQNTHGTLFFACPVWLSHSTCLHALTAPGAEWDVPASTAILDLSGCRLSRIWKDFVGSALMIIFFSFFTFNTSGSVCFKYTSSMVVRLIAEEILQVLFLQVCLEPSIGREDHLSCHCWWAYARAMKV